MVNRLSSGIAEVSGNVAPVYTINVAICGEIAPVAGALSLVVSAVSVAASDETSSSPSGHSSCPGSHRQCRHRRRIRQVRRWGKATKALEGEQLTSAPSRGETAVQVWVNDLDEPDEILVLAYAG